jgi:hypothetical protein
MPVPSAVGWIACTIANAMPMALPLLLRGARRLHHQPSSMWPLRQHQWRPPLQRRHRTMRRKLHPLQTRLNPRRHRTALSTVFQFVLGDKVPCQSNGIDFGANGPQLALELRVSALEQGGRDHVTTALNSVKQYRCATLRCGAVSSIAGKGGIRRLHGECN